MNNHRNDNMTETIDMRHVQTSHSDGTNDREQWDKLIKLMDTGEKILIDQSVYWYFLEVLPPVWQFGSGFFFAEGMEKLKRFSETGEEYAVQQIDVFNPSCYGEPCREDLEAAYQRGELAST